MHSFQIPANLITKEGAICKLWHLCGPKWIYLKAQVLNIPKMVSDWPNHVGERREQQKRGRAKGLTIAWVVEGQKLLKFFKTSHRPKMGIP